MAVPKTTETRCRDGSVQARQVIKRLHKQPHPYIFLFFSPHGIDVPRILIAKLTEQFQVKRTPTAPTGLMTNFTNPRLIQQPSQDSFTLSVNISVQWELSNPADDVTGYEVYMGYEELRPYDMFPSDSAVERRCAPGTVVREQVVEQQMMGY